MSKPFEEIVKRQLGWRLKGEFKVVKICKFGFPQVIENKPFLNGKPFPTLFWLTCPFLRKKVSRLEERGFVEYFELKLKYNHRFRNTYLKAQSLERSLRKLFIPKSLPFGVKKKLLSVGIGGMENPLGVKCLHLHLADYLGGIPNPVGKEVLKLIKVEECSDNYCGLKLFDKKRPKLKACYEGF